jgi:orotate phosphoribosyltransferase
MTDRISQIARDTAQILLDTKSVLVNAREPFVYTSGRRGPVYVDCRRLISFVKERGQLMNFAAQIAKEKIGADKIDYVAGGETAGIPYAAFIAERLKKPMLYVRKKPKGFGRMAQIEGQIDKDGARVLLVEDVQNFGASVKVFIDALREAGAKVSDLVVIFSHGHASSAQNMKDMGMNLHALCDWWAVLDVAKSKNYFDKATLASVESYLNNPDAWADDNKVTKNAL